MKKLISFLAVCFLSAHINFAFAGFVAGEDYVVLDKPVKTLRRTRLKCENYFGTTVHIVLILNLWWIGG